MNKNNIVCDCEVIHPEVLGMVKNKMKEDMVLDKLADFFKVFGDGTRIKILWALEISEMCVCDLAVLLNMSKSAISHQLRVLRDKKIVKFRKKGRNVFYSLHDHHVKDILEIGIEHIEHIEEE